jgi:hypothetical protein
MRRDDVFTMLLAPLLFAAALLALIGCGAIESDDYGVGSCIHSRHFFSNIIVRVVNQTAYKGWIVEAPNGDRYLLSFDTPDLEAVPCPESLGGPQ